MTKTITPKEFQEFLINQNVINEFYIELFFVEHNYNFMEESTLANVQEHELFDETKEVLVDTIQTEGFEDILDNGFLFHYEGNHDNTITNIDWASIREEYKKSLKNEVKEEIFSLGITGTLTSYAYFHNFTEDFQTFFTIDKEFKIFNKTYRVTSFDKHRNQVHANQLLKTNKISKTKKVVISEKIVSF